jgi:translation initiation factor IF-1
VITGVNACGEFRVKLVNGQLVRATMCQELHEWFVRLLPGDGDKVEVNLENPHGKRRVIVDRRLPGGRGLLAALHSRASGTPFPPGLDS